MKAEIMSFSLISECKQSVATHVFCLRSKMTRTIAPLEDGQQFGFGADPRELPESELFVVQQLAECHGQTPRVRALSQHPLEQDPGDTFGHVAILRSSGE